MKKILGIVALTLIAGAPVFAADTTAIDYVLQVGGSNAGGPTVPFDTTLVKEEGDPGIYDAGTNIVTWSVKVLASGAIDVGGNPVYIGGASNLVWDLTLLGPDGQPVGTVGTPFGLGSAAAPGFFSSIQDGSGLYKLQPAAFTWEFGGGAPFGRLNDVDTANGANAVQYTFPSTYSFYHNDVTDAVYNTTATVLAPTGTLKGMGAGFQDLNLDATPIEKTGVGILADLGIYSCIQPIGDKAPIAEGQINLTGLASGTYTLVLTPGTGNNVIWADGLSCQIGTSGAFAVPAATVTGGSISFIHEGTVPVNPPVMASAASVRTHGAAGTFGMPLNIGAGNATSEPRVDTAAGSNPMIVVGYDVALSAIPADLPVVVATSSGAAPTVGTPVVVGNLLQIPVTGSADKTCVTLTITGVKAPGSAAAPLHTVKVTYRKGDVDNSRSVGPADINAVKAKSSIANVNATNFWFDLDCSSKTGPSDITLVKGLSAIGVTACALP